MKVLKDIRIIILLAAIVMSLLLISPNPWPSGMKITYVGENLSSKMQPGEILYMINDMPATQDAMSKEYRGTVKFETGSGVKFASVDGNIDMTTAETDPTKLKFGLDIKGGTRAFVKVNSSDPDMVSQVISTLQNRINFFGLKDASFRQVDRNYVEISMAAGRPDELKTLIEQQGVFEAKIPMLLAVRNNKTQLRLEKTHNISVEGGGIRLDEKSYAWGSVVSIDGIDIEMSGVVNGLLNMSSTVFTGDDIKTVFSDPQRSRIQPVEGGEYVWSFAVQLSPDGASRFAKITRNLDVVPGGRESYLSSQIYFYLDGSLLDSLNIVSSLRGREETEISITGSSGSIDESSKERARLQSILRSGALPASIEIVQMDSVSPSLGEEFLKGAVLAGIAAIIGVVCVVTIRYRKFRIILPMIVISLSEVLIILGVSVLIGWTIDVAAVAGIIAAVGTGIDSQIIILDLAVRRERTESMREKLRDAFFIIFGAAGTVIAAMLPLMIIGFGALRGFAITTMIGVLAGIFITRPAFGAIVEKLIKD